MDVKVKQKKPIPTLDCATEERNWFQVSSFSRKNKNKTKIKNFLAR